MCLTTWLYLYGFILALHIIILYPNVFTALVISNQFHCSDIGDKLSPSMIRSVTEMPKIRTKRPKLINFTVQTKKQQRLGTKQHKLVHQVHQLILSLHYWSHDLKSISLFRQWRQVVADCNQKCHSGGNLFDCFDFCGVLGIF